MNSPGSPNYLKVIGDLKRSARPPVAAFSREIEKIAAQQGIQAAYNHLLRAEVMLGLRKPTLAVYDHAFQLIGGAQRYGLTLASVLKDQFDITIIANKEVSHRDFLSWYNLDLSPCRIKIAKIPYYEERNASFLDPAFISAKIDNPFHLISRESGNYDVFVNNSMNEMVYPLSNISVLICHFPERRPKSYFYADQYTYVIYNSRYTAEWIEKTWKFAPHQHIYPPVDLEVSGPGPAKKNIVLSVARFEPEGTKRQKEMIEAFGIFNDLYPELAREWKFVLVGGSGPGNRYLTQLQSLINEQTLNNIELRVNIPVGELRTLYQESTLFWHLCGLRHDHPSEIEHFGMTVVEAMQNRVVPIVYDGGGLREIVDHGVNGFRVRTKAELLEYSLTLFRDQKRVQGMGEAARQRAQDFSRTKFEERVKAFFDRVLAEYNPL